MTGPRPSRPRRFDSPRQEAYLGLWRTYDKLRAVEDELFAQYDLTPQQYNTLRLLRAEAPQAVPTLELAGRLISHAPDITRLIDKLEQRGLVARERPSQNRRQVLIRITDDGLAFLRQLDEPVRQCHERQLGHLTAEQLQQLNELLRVVRARHEAEDSPWR